MSKLPSVKGQMTQGEAKLREQKKNIKTTLEYLLVILKGKIPTPKTEEFQKIDALITEINEIMILQHDNIFITQGQNLINRIKSLKILDENQSKILLAYNNLPKTPGTPISTSTPDSRTSTPDSRTSTPGSRTSTPGSRTSTPISTGTPVSTPISTGTPVSTPRSTGTPEIKLWDPIIKTLNNFYLNDEKMFFPCINDNFKGNIEFFLKTTLSDVNKNHIILQRIRKVENTIKDIRTKIKIRNIICVYLNLHFFHEKLTEHVQDLEKFLETNLPKHNHILETIRELCEDRSGRYICAKHNFDKFIETDFSAFIQKDDNIQTTLEKLGKYLNALKDTINDIINNPTEPIIITIDFKEKLPIAFGPDILTYGPTTTEQRIGILKKMSFTELTNLINEICKVINVEFDEINKKIIKNRTDNPKLLEPGCQFTEEVNQQIKDIKHNPKSKPKYEVTINTKTIILTKQPSNQGLFMIYYHTYKYIITHLLYNMVQLLIALKHIDTNEDIKKAFNPPKIRDSLDKVIKAMVGFNLFYSNAMYDLYGY
jgi:hypothetical protein